MDNSSTLLLNLLTFAVGNEGDRECVLKATPEDWKAVIDLAASQAVVFTAVDGLDKFYEKYPDEDLSLNDLSMRADKYQWYGSILYAERDYSNYCNLIAKISKLFASNGIRTMVFKGYCCSLDWPVPEHRSMGDIDIYLFGDSKAGDAVIEAKGIKVDNSHHHHSEFQIQGTLVENHFDFINVHSHKSGRRIEASLKLLADESLKQGKTVKLGSSEIYLPTEQFNAIFLMRHMAIHFAAEQMYLRQLLDWALFVRNHHQCVDWKSFWNDVESMGMMQFVLSVNSICVSHLGFDKAIFHTPDGIDADSDTTSRVLADILKPIESHDGITGIKYVYVRLVLWLKNAWKNRIVYSDSLFSTFFYQIVSHLKKPTTIFK